MTSRVDIVIVNWNAGEQLGECLDSISRYGDDLVGHVIVVDNGSIDGSDALAERDGVTLIRTGRNLGFGAACNIGARRCSCDYILLLNPDAMLRPGTLAATVSHLDRHVDVAVVGVRLVDERDDVHRHCARFPTWRSFVGPSLGLDRITRGKFPPVTLHEFDHMSDRSVDHVMGAYYLIRREVYQALGGFDEAFFVYLEDLDLSVRVARAGWRIAYLAGPVAFHRQGGTSGRVKAKRLAYVWESNIIFSWKHHAMRHALLVSAVTLLLEPLSRGARAVIAGRPADALTILKGGMLLVARLPGVARRIRKARRGHTA